VFAKLKNVTHSVVGEKLPENEQFSFHQELGVQRCMVMVNIAGDIY